MLHYDQLINSLKRHKPPIIKSNRKGISYYNIECGFDIETTSTTNEDGDKFAFMYVWQFGIGYGQPVYYGRTWDEFRDFLHKLSDVLNLSENLLLPVYVHNLPYEFSFMCKELHWVHGSVYCRKERDVIRATSVEGIEFRCSLALSGQSLDNTARNLTKYEVRKLKGDLDYNLVRHSETPLTADEIKYCINDIQIILAYIKEWLLLNNDISQIPSTKTGIVRKFMKDLHYKRDINGKKIPTGTGKRYRNLINGELTLTPFNYLQCNQAFTGGYTHSNANYRGRVLHDVTSVDLSSSYPSVMLSEKMPMGKLITFVPNEDEDIKTQFIRLCQNFAVIFTATFTNLKKKVTQDCYISESKCEVLGDRIIDNGRIEFAESVKTTLTSVDFEIFQHCYEWDDMSLIKGSVIYCVLDWLPKPMVQGVLKLYEDKTTLKGVEGREVDYMMGKAMLNSTYGMCVTELVKDEHTFNTEWECTTPDIDEKITNYNNARKRFLYYPWGIWITACARRNLWKGIIAVGDDYIYSDTDSIKLFNYEKHKPYFDSYNKRIKEKMVEMCKFHNLDVSLLEPANKYGDKKPMGIWEYEGTYDRFKVLTSKQYLAQHKDKYELTVAGLPKPHGIKYLKEISNNDSDMIFNNFKVGLSVPKEKSGKLGHTYIDDEMTMDVTDYLGNTIEVTASSSCHLSAIDFSISSVDDRASKLINEVVSGVMIEDIT